MGQLKTSLVQSVWYVSREQVKFTVYGLREPIATVPAMIVVEGQ